MKIKATTKVNLNFKLIAELEGKAMETALRKTAEWILSEVQSSGKVPKLTGALEISGYVSFIAGEVFARVMFDTPYARRWYFNNPHPKTGKTATFSQALNANAQDHWMDDFIYGDRKNEVVEKFAEFYKEELGGLLK